MQDRRVNAHNYIHFWWLLALKKHIPIFIKCGSLSLFNIWIYIMLLVFILIYFLLRALFGTNVNHVSCVQVFRDRILVDLDVGPTRFCFCLWISCCFNLWRSWWKGVGSWICSFSAHFVLVYFFDVPSMPRALSSLLVWCDKRLEVSAFSNLFWLISLSSQMLCSVIKQYLFYFVFDFIDICYVYIMCTRKIKYETKQGIWTGNSNPYPLFIAIGVKSIVSFIFANGQNHFTCVVLVISL